MQKEMACTDRGRASQKSELNKIVEYLKWLESKKSNQISAQGAIMPIQYHTTISMQYQTYFQLNRSAARLPI